MYRLTTFSLKEMTELGATLRHVGDGLASMEAVAAQVATKLYEEFGEGSDKEIVLARVYKTHPFGTLPSDLQAFARTCMPDAEIVEATKCLTLLGTDGARPEWKHRSTSKGHKAIPLPSAVIVDQLPMVSQLVRQFGLEVHALVSSDPALLVDTEQRKYNVFFVADAQASPFIPAQADFVVPLGVRSVLGFGGLLPGGELFAVILFSKVLLSRETADLFKTLALNVKMALLPFVGAEFS